MGGVALGPYVLFVFQKGGIWQAEFPKERTVLCGGYEESNRHSLAQKALDRSAKSAEAGIAPSSIC